MIAVLATFLALYATAHPAESTHIVDLIPPTVLAVLISGVFAFATQRRASQATEKAAKLASRTAETASRDERETEAFTRAEAIYRNLIDELQEELAQVKAGRLEDRAALERCHYDLTAARRTIRHLRGAQS